MRRPYYALMLSAAGYDVPGRIFCRWANAMRAARRLAEAGFTITIIEA